MTVRIRTARLSYGGDDRLDITRSGAAAARRKGRTALGEPFAPSERLVYPTIEWMTNIAALRARAEAQGTLEALVVVAGLHSAIATAYADLYEAEMRVSYGLRPGAPTWGPLEELAVERGVKPMPAAWKWALAQESIVGVCFCVDPNVCHRVLWARIMEKLGATYEGEVTR